MFIKFFKVSSVVVRNFFRVTCSFHCVQNDKKLGFIQISISVRNPRIKNWLCYAGFFFYSTGRFAHTYVLCEK